MDPKAVESEPRKLPISRSQRTASDAGKGDTTYARARTGPRPWSRLRSDTTDAPTLYTVFKKGFDSDWSTR